MVAIGEAPDDIETFGEFEKTQIIDPDEVSRKFNQYNIFINTAKMKISPRIDDSAFLALIGPRRTGKSELSLATAFAIDPDFPIDNICFSFDELKALLTDDTIRKQPIVWEEASVTAYNREFMDEVNILLNKYFQVFGFRNLAVIANFQHINLLDYQVRMQLDVLLRCKSYYGTDPQGNTFTRKTVFPFKVLNDGINEPLIVKYKVPGDMGYDVIGEIPVPQIDILHKMYGIKNSFIQQYKKRKNEFFKNLEGKEKKVDEKEVAMLKKKEEALAALARSLQDQGLSQDDIGGLMGIKRQTASSWNIFKPKKVDAEAVKQVKKARMKITKTTKANKKKSLATANPPALNQPRTREKPTTI
ncbi:hypothetical protein MSSAC_0201 [Methanosarcina siciliae C2J]|uniref:Uncharacterized protein n=1 Tax=Methanosarcina siciliae C2J TaxID=1434118 RepID=A0A0E3LC27_9EURY|nr:hypothetical protein [Methanosarcina siciliae]AKB34791.1 hypothetical protein MSSAC_0201 [Methanosarcina siciliae C2J]